MEGAPTVAVLVPTYRRPESLRNCLIGLAGQSHRAAQVIVIARETDEPTIRALAGPAPDGLPLEVAEVRVPGQVAALNAGLIRVSADIVAITDDDAVPRPDWLARIVAHFGADPRLGALGGRDWVHHHDQLVDGESAIVGRLLWYGRFVGFHHLGAGSPREVDVLKGVNMSYRRAALDGLEFDTGLRGTGAQHHNDWAMSLAVKAAGWRVLYDPLVAVDHYEAERSEDDPRFAHEPQIAAVRARNQTYAAVRHLPTRRWLVHVLYAFLIGTTAAPGLGIALVNLLEGQQPVTATLRELGLSFASRAAGLTAGLYSRTAHSTGS